jgi:hypothetical protein
MSKQASYFILPLQVEPSFKSIMPSDLERWKDSNQTVTLLAKLVRHDTLNPPFKIMKFLSIPV